MYTVKVWGLDNIANSIIVTLTHPYAAPKGINLYCSGENIVQSVWDSVLAFCRAANLPTKSLDLAERAIYEATSYMSSILDQYVINAL